MGQTNDTSERRADLLKQIEDQQAIQQRNPPTSQVWQDASKRMHELIEQMTGKPAKDAQGRAGRPPLCRHCGLDVSEHSRISKACPGPVASVLKMKYYEADFSNR